MANKAKDLTGMKFNRWTVLERDDVDSSGNATWLCECSCEKKTQKSVSSYSLKSGRSKSCGCFAVESSIERNIKKTLDL